MSQSRKSSFVESLMNTFSAFLLSVAVYQTLVPWIWGLHISLGANLGITILFTVLSIGRNYIWRRWFNGAFRRDQA